MRKFTLIIIVILCHILPSKAQDDVKVIQKLDSLDYGTTLPKEILQTKSIAIVKTLPKSTDPYIRGDWKALAKKAQPGFKKAGIDVVVYYHIEDIYSGKESYASFLEDFKKRELKNVVFLIQDDSTYRIVLSKIPHGSHLIKTGQQAWQIKHSNLAEALDDLYLKAANSPQEITNLLILEVPEFGAMTNPITGRRGEYYDLNFSSYKLAVPAFADTAKINAAMADYPYTYGLTSTSPDEKELRSKGYQYVFYYVHTTGRAVKQILGYPTTDTETVYISQVTRDGETHLSSYNVNTPVYKFYIKHIYSGNVYLGKKWDAAPSWQEALQNYIDNLRTELIRD